MNSCPVTSSSCDLVPLAPLQTAFTTVCVYYSTDKRTNLCTRPLTSNAFSGNISLSNRFRCCAIMCQPMMQQETAETAAGSGPSVSLKFLTPVPAPAPFAAHHLGLYPHGVTCYNIPFFLPDSSPCPAPIQATQ